MRTTTPDIENSRLQFERDGFCLAPPLIPTDLVERAIPRMDAVIAGEYETGVPPHAVHFSPSDGPDKLKKVDQPNLCDRTLLEFVSHPALGEWVAQLMGAEWIQAWAIQLLVKPPGGGKGGVVGWHQDKHYWPYWEGEVFTAWVAVSEVTAEMGPMRFIRGSHQWGFLEGGDFFGSDCADQLERMKAPAGEKWEEVPALLEPGAASLHHKLTLHASGPNLSDRPRRSFAIHLRTEKSKPVRGSDYDNYYIDDLDDPVKAPVLFGA